LKIDSPGQVAAVIERFLSGSGRYPQEFNDFIDSAVIEDPRIEAYRRKCELLHGELEPRRNQLAVLSLEEGARQTMREAAAKKELEEIAAELRLLEQGTADSG
jgi:exosome complex RNA-binding protein Csl4